MAEIEKRIFTDNRQAIDSQTVIDLPVFSAEDAALRDKALAELTEHERTTLRHRERWLHRRRASDQLMVR